MPTTIQSLRVGRRDERGFTLIELLVVVLILGVLAAVVVFSVGGISNRGRNSSCQIEVREVRTAIEAYKTQNNNANPPTLATLVTAGLLETAPGPTTATGSASPPFTYDPVAGTYAGGTCPTG